MEAAWVALSFLWVLSSSCRREMEAWPDKQPWDEKPLHWGPAAQDSQCLLLCAAEVQMWVTEGTLPARACPSGCAGSRVAPGRWLRPHWLAQGKDAPEMAPAITGCSDMHSSALQPKNNHHCLRRQLQSPILLTWITYCWGLLCSRWCCSPVPHSTAGYSSRCACQGWLQKQENRTYCRLQSQEKTLQHTTFPCASLKKCTKGGQSPPADINIQQCSNVLACLFQPEPQEKRNIIVVTTNIQSFPVTYLTQHHTKIMGRRQ